MQKINFDIMSLDIYWKFEIITALTGSRLQLNNISGGRN